MVIACFTNRYSNTIASGLWQYDYGQSLRVQGLTLPTAVEIHFSLHETGGESVTRVGVTKDGATDVIIPDSMLEGNGSVRDYKIYAFIYLADEKSGETTHKIIMPVKARPKPEAFDEPEDAEIFREAIAAVNEAVENAKESVTPTIGENGNWFVGGEDTGKPSTGKKGDTGNDGVSVTHEWDGTVLKVTSASGMTSADLKGAKGDKGDTGAQGPQGVKGETGATGPRGETGLQGEKGEKGDTGAQGPQGIQGATGPKGDKGDTGEQGPKGEKGDKGDPGTDGRDGVGSWNDLEDKPFYEESEIAEVLPETTFTIDDSGSGIELTLLSSLVLGEEYTIIANGETYKCVAREFDFDGSMCVGIGNIGTVSGGENTGEPFIVIEAPEDILEQLNGGNGLLGYFEDAKEITIRIYSGGYELHQIEPKYIPCMKSAGIGSEPLLETTISNSEYAQGNVLSIVEGKEYVVEFDGTEYLCTAKSMVIEGASILYLGNGAIVETDVTEEPFIVLSGNDVISVMGYGTIVYAYTMSDGEASFTEGTHTISIRNVGKPYMIDPEYIEDMYYTEEGEEVEIEILPEVSFTTSYKSNDYIEMQAGDICIVTMNGVQYTCATKTISDDSMNGYFLGNAGLINGINDTGEPFMIAIPEKSSIEEMGYGMFIVVIVTKDDGFVDLQATVTMSISKLVKEEIVHPIQGKYISDSTLRNTALNWIPHSSEEICLVSEKTITSSKDIIEELKSYMITVDQPLIVYFDGTRYECPGGEFLNLAYGNLSETLGSFISEYAGVGSDIPFCVAITEDETKFAYLKDEGNHTVSFYVYKQEKLPTRYNYYYIESLPEKNDYSDELLLADRAGVMAHMGATGRVLMFNYSDAGDSRVGYVDNKGYHIRQFSGEGFSEYTAALFETDGVSVGQHLEVESVNNGLVVFKAVDPNALTSPNGTKYRITVDDAGTLKAEEITE